MDIKNLIESLGSREVLHLARSRDDLPDGGEVLRVYGVPLFACVTTNRPPGRPREVPDEVRHRAAELRDEGLTYAEIADRLNDEGFTTSTGTEWTRPGAHRLVQQAQQQRQDD